MEELPFEIKIIGIALSVVAIIFLFSYDKLVNLVRRSPQSSKKK
jgi:hypothetical protein